MEIEYNSEAPIFSLDGYEIKAKVIDCYDGDTITCIFPLPFDSNKKQFKWKCRLDGIDTPEIKSKNPREQKWALAAKTQLQDLVLNKEIEIKCHKFDKYGRLLVTIWTKASHKDERININNLLLQKGLACVYNGKTSKVDWDTLPYPLDENED